jgi:histidinol-phosphate aminotransferase
MKTIDNLVRENIKRLKPYSSAREEFGGNDFVMLDANENPFGNELNRYPDPLQVRLKSLIAERKQVDWENIFLGNGSDEIIDLLIRAFCQPGKDNIVTIDPTFGMYQVMADLNQVSARKSNLDLNFQLDAEDLLSKCDENTKMVFLCSPNNPSGNVLSRLQILKILNEFQGIVVIDEAYIDFSDTSGYVDDLRYYPNLVVLQTLSKAWGLAGIRLGMAFAEEEIVDVLNRMKCPYNVNRVTQEIAVEKMRSERKINQQIREIKKEREKLIVYLDSMDFVVRVNPSDANFVLVKVQSASDLYDYLKNSGFIVRDRSTLQNPNLLRITVGTPRQNRRLIKTLNNYKL